jgi:CcmD family protein
MPNFLLEPGFAIYAALAVALAVWIGIFAFLWRIDRQMRELRRRLDQAPPAEAPAPRATLEARATHQQTRMATNDE